jgi:phosphoribosylamine---glycine ligase
MSYHFLVPKGYPETAKAGQILDVNESKINEEGALVYYAAVNQTDDKIFTSASRALGLVGIGDSIAEAEQICEGVTRFVKGDIYHRKDVGTAELIQKRIDHMEKIRSFR